MLLPKEFKQASEIIEQIEHYGYEAYFVGGCVRDLLLERKVGDIDIATSAEPHVSQEIFEKVIPVGLEHGTVIVRHKHQSYEVTTFRVDDDYSDQRHPDSVKFVKTIKQDLKRRDFTINALAMGKNGNIIDPFSGKKNLKNNLIKAVGDASDRFKEDPLRIMRALRFSSQLGFSLEAKTLDAMESVVNEIETITMERIVQETSKFFSGVYVKNGLYYFRKINITKYLPILKKNPYIIDRLPANIKPLNAFASVIAMLHFIEPDVAIRDWVKQWKCSNMIKSEAENIYEALLTYQLDGLNRWLVYRLHGCNYRDFTALVNMLFREKLTNEKVKQIRNSLPIESKKDLTINGTDLLELFPGKTPGHWMGETLDQIEKEVVLGNLSNRKNVLKEWMKWNLHETD